MSYRIGCVPYVNAKPLVKMFEHVETPVSVSFEVPSGLPKLLDSRQADAVLASSFDALRTSGRSIAAGVCIGSDGPAESVRLFSKVPFEDIRTVAFDASSLTSNHLARLILAENYGIWAEGAPEPPDLHQMLQVADACVLIGDIGMRSEGAGLKVLDLGLEWKKMTALPFVWAVWIGREDFPPELAEWLRRAERWGRENREQVVRETVAESGWPEPVARHYLNEVMRYPMGERELEGLRLFGSLLMKHGIASTSAFPKLV